MLSEAYCTVYAALTGRSPQWPRVRRAWLAVHPACAACGDESAVEVHHIEPVQVAPAKELDPTNLISLCRECHACVGHVGGHWSMWNANVREAAALLLAGRRPGSDP